MRFDMYGGPGVSQGAGENVFRDAEKQYQFHRDQIIRQRNGHAHGTRLVTRPSDLSSLVDLRDENTWSFAASTGSEPTGVARHDIMLLNDFNNEEAQERLPASAFTFPAHPGLVIIPGAISSTVQCQLIVDSLCVYPEPPSNTNHTLRYGHLPGLWHAATLPIPPNRKNLGGKERRDSDAEALRLSFKLTVDGPLGAKIAAKRAIKVAQEDSSSKFNKSVVAGGQREHDHDLAYKRQEQQEQQQHVSDHQSEGMPCPSQIPSSLWVRDGPGPSAKQMLHKLRWSTLGPQFNWSAREYEDGSTFRPLPSILRNLSVSIAEAVTELWELDAQDEEHLRMPSLPNSDSTAGLTLSTCECNETHWTINSALSLDSAHKRRQRRRPERPFSPDAAIVNYYREGDTLGGHLDDVEADMEQPIVSVSLGCEAVFLVGGKSRDVKPTAVLVRSGDVVVLAGHARKCYHGVPRIFCDRALPPALQNELQGLPSVLEHIAKSRINISIRAVK
ncbi:hypothetical protein CEUSTIGMA_g9816.t1 [Chlamydomonas eustigma]|uniref:Fe2OG dioxygenase domain-containing protein n=1 Tax=Chlamydomonas eustigma TaxID=1157962 RepID=A0A250XH40_9CHLO|nr:hypothetical protein CEUSTIGMA_g9816.t1 [Chlamydomonas eustigma]|eukprot:GAX82388.1 hypothetical protein CEUSTIGMA_g9816.t1 [Chlamydomonas eustigma]